MKKIIHIITKILSAADIIMSIAFIFMFAMIVSQCLALKENTEKYLMEPEIGDLYVVQIAEIDGSGYDDVLAIGVMKLIKIDGNMLTFSIPEKAYIKRLPVHLEDEYSDDTIILSKDDIYALRNRGVMKHIKRK